MTGPDDPDEARSTRLAHLGDESNIRSVGQLCYLVTFFSALGTLEFALFALGVLPEPPELKAIAGPGLVRVAFWGLAVGFLVNTMAQAALGYGLTHLQSWARWTVVGLTVASLGSHIVLSLAATVARPAVGLIALTVGAAIHGLILRPLLGRRPDVVFSADYREVIRRTPEIRARMHPLLAGLIGLILAAVVGFLGFLGAIYFRLID